MKHGEELMEFEEITEDIIGAAFEVFNVLGYGFLEKVYQRAMQVELIRRGRNVILEHPIKVEFKVAKEYNQNDEPQLLNELKATGVKVGMFINFWKTKVQFKRFIY